LLSIYDKSEKDNLTDGELAALLDSIHSDYWQNPLPTNHLINLLTN
jgi:hypothetical protein